MRIIAVVSVTGLFAVAVIVLFELDRLPARWLADRRRRRERGGWLL